MPAPSEFDKLHQLKADLVKERASFISHYQELADYVQPRRGRFSVNDRNRGDKRHQSIINSAATQALRKAQSGMLAGSMSPARPWFTLDTGDTDLRERKDVKEWMYIVERVLRDILNEGNFYGQASAMLGELLLFGTGCMTHVDDFDDVARFYTHTVGSYAISQNEKFQVDTLLREFQMTTIQLVEKFGLENVTTHVKDLYDKGQYFDWHDVWHIVQPNSQYKSESGLGKDKPYRSVWYQPAERGGNKNTKYLRVGGFDEFPAYCPRWEVTGEDVYGTSCPGIVSLGDIKQLQVEEKRKAQGIDKMVNPPLGGPASVRNVPVQSLPGGLTVYDAIGNQKLEPLYTVNPQLGELRADISAVEQRINEGFFVDLFLAISTMEGIQPRNQLDLMQRNEERLLQLGPVLERLHGEFLNPMINRLFNQCVRADILPEPPEALAGRDLKVKFISTLAQAQRAVATQSIDRTFMFAGSLAEIWPDAAAKLDAQQAIDEYALAVGAPPSIVVSDEQIEEQRAAEEQRAQQADALAAASSIANTAKMASDAKTGESNLLNDLTKGAE